MQKKILKKRNNVEESVVAMSASHCNKYCGNKAKCNCGSMPSEYQSSYNSSKKYYFSGQYDLYINL